jgi:hypothetical protein
MTVGEINDDWSVLNARITPGDRIYKKIEQLVDSNPGSSASSVFDSTELRDDWMGAGWEAA